MAALAALLVAAVLGCRVLLQQAAGSRLYWPQAKTPC